MPAALRGAGHHRLVLGAAGLALLLAATVLAALAALTEHAVEGGTQRRLARDPDAVIAVLGDPRAPDTNTSTAPTPADGSDADRRSDADPASRDARASGDAPAAPGIASASEPGADDVDTLVRAAVDRAFGGVPHHTWSALRAPASRSAELDVIEVDGHPRDDVRLSVVALEQSRRHTDLVVGRAPRGTGDGRTLETALDEVFAADLGVRPGDALRIRPGSGPEVTLRVTGLYRPSGTSPAVWAHLGTTTFGASDSVALVPRPALLATPGLAADTGALWLAVPDADRLRLADIGPLRERAARFEGSDTSRSVFRGAPSTTTLTVTSRLDNALDDLATPIAVARAGLYVPAGLLAALATAALVFTARQLAEHRRPALALLAARGAGT
ncbi:hypothetical protein G3I20_07805, partial [Streptomyces sp. SID8111]|nr:hypothetical protein [Streptomyces sp. SID8111]